MPRLPRYLVIRAPYRARDVSEFPTQQSAINALCALQAAGETDPELVIGFGCTHELAANAKARAAARDAARFDELVTVAFSEWREP